MVGGRGEGVEGRQGIPPPGPHAHVSLYIRMGAARRMIGGLASSIHSLHLCLTEIREETSSISHIFPRWNGTQPDIRTVREEEG